MGEGYSRRSIFFHKKKKRKGEEYICIDWDSIGRGCGPDLVFTVGFLGSRSSYSSSCQYPSVWTLDLATTMMILVYANLFTKEDLGYHGQFVCDGIHWQHRVRKNIAWVSLCALLYVDMLGVGSSSLLMYVRATVKNCIGTNRIPVSVCSLRLGDCQMLIVHWAAWSCRLSVHISVPHGN